MTGPLDRIQVLDFTRALAGPYCSLMLSDMGADVLKIEQPGVGDNTRAWGPPFQGGESSYFLSVNRNKRSIALNLRDECGKQVVRDLIARSDVLLENFVPGTLERLGFGYDVCRAIKPDLIYCAVSGFGQIGPERERAAYDQILQGLGGVMSFTGDVGGPPLRVGVAIADIMAGMFAAYAVVAALFHRQRTGEGQMVDTSLLDGQLALLTYQSGRYFATGESPRNTGNDHPTIVPYGMYQAADGYFNLAVGTNDLWRRFCSAMGLEELRDDPRFDTNPHRSANREALQSILVPLFATMHVAEIESRMKAVGVPCGAVHNLQEVFSDPQVQALGSVQELEHPTAGTIKVVGPPYRMSATPASVRMPPPLLGEHTDAVLQELGYDADAIAALREGGVIG